jgi:hypothetical protein
MEPAGPADRLGGTPLRVGVARDLVSDLLQLGFVGDGLEVVTGRVGPFEGREFFGGELDLQRPRRAWS